MTEQLPDETEALFIAAIEHQAKKAKEAARTKWANRYGNGETRKFRAPDGSALGVVLREDPDPSWVVHSYDDLEAALADVEAAWELSGQVLLPSGDVVECHAEDELYMVLAAHAPHLVKAPIPRLRRSYVNELLAKSLVEDEPAAPGISKHWPHGRLVVRTAEGAGAAFARLMRAGVIGWDGRPALPSGDSNEQADGSTAEGLAS